MNRLYISIAGARPGDLLRKWRVAGNRYLLGDNA
jgi:hypothetical protein